MFDVNTVASDKYFFNLLLLCPEHLAQRVQTLHLKHCSKKKNKKCAINMVDLKMIVSQRLRKQYDHDHDHGVPRRTVVEDRHFNNLWRSHLQSQVTQKMASAQVVETSELPPTILLRAPITQMIIIFKLCMLLLDSNHFLP